MLNRYELVNEYPGLIASVVAVKQHPTITTGCEGLFVVLMSVGPRAVHCCSEAVRHGAYDTVEHEPGL